jgi:hypothetical protein
MAETEVFEPLGPDDEKLRVAGVGMYERLIISYLSGTGNPLSRRGGLPTTGGKRHGG